MLRSTSIRGSVHPSISRSVTPSHFWRFWRASEHCVASIGSCWVSKWPLLASQWPLWASKWPLWTSKWPFLALKWLVWASKQLFWASKQLFWISMQLFWVSMQIFWASWVTKKPQSDAHAVGEAVLTFKKCSPILSYMVPNYTLSRAHSTKNRKILLGKSDFILRASFSWKIIGCCDFAF